MKKIGLVAGASFLAGALFFALFFGYFQAPNVEGNKNGTGILSQGAVLQQPVAEADSVNIKSRGMNFAPLVKKVRPAVVKVMSESMRQRRTDIFDQFFRRRSPQRERVPGMGSGFFISADGYIITNNHVVQDAIKVSIKTLDDQEFPARIIGTDPRTDLALLKVNAKDMPFISLGDSEKVEVGEWVLAIGNPLNQDLSVTAGIISAKGRQLGMAQYEDFLQTDAAINMGNSGGPLINMEGRVIGINSAILAPSGGNIGIGFAIPSNMAQKVVKDLKTRGRVVRGYMGINVDWLDEKDAEEFDMPEKGVLITKVEKDSPAEAAGVKKYDLIVAVNGKKLKKALDLSITIADSSPGDIVQLTLIRDSKRRTINVKVGESPDSLKYISSGEQGRSFDLGMTLVENTPSLSREFRLGTSKGLLVRSVKRGGTADDNGLRANDVILEVNGKELDRVEAFRRTVEKKKPGSVLLLYIHRDGDEGMIRFRLPE